MIARKTSLQSYASGVDMGATSKDCWLWTKGKQSQGYGVLYVDGRPRLAHRAAYELFVGPIPEGLFVCHRCDIPACVNPIHLFVGTAGDNARDMCLKGRRVPPAPETHPRGEAVGMSKLRTEQVREIRSLGIPQYQIADRYGVSQATVSLIRNRKAWRHVQ